MAKRTDTVEAPVRGGIVPAVHVPEAALAMTPDRAVVVEDDADYRDIQELTFPGANMIPKLHLLGIPFVIVGLRFQDVMRTERGWRDYVTIDAFVTEEDIVRDALDKGRILKSPGRDAEVHTRMEDLPVKPEERILINDGSTGVRRQIVDLLERLGLVDVGHHDEQANGTLEGVKHRHDLAWSEWADPALAADQVASSWVSANGTEIPAFRSFPDGRPLIVGAARGLTGSVYPNDMAPSGWATTYYVR
jgi:hypothetical protein